MRIQNRAWSLESKVPILISYSSTETRTETQTDIQNSIILRTFCRKKQGLRGATWLCIGWDSVNWRLPPPAAPTIPHLTKTRKNPKPTSSTTTHHHNQRLCLCFRKMNGVCVWKGSEEWKEWLCCGTSVELNPQPKHTHTNTICCWRMRGRVRENCLMMVMMEGGVEVGAGSWPWQRWAHIPLGRFLFVLFWIQKYIQTFPSAHSIHST